MEISKLKDAAKAHLVDSTALLAASSPVFCAFETMIAKMSNDVSLHTRLYVMALTYAGLGYAIGKGRDMSRKIFNITQETRERFQQIHDSLYLSAINIPLSAGLYAASGETDIKKIAAGTISAVIFGALLGPLIGYSMDVYRDLTELSKCERRAYPEIIRGLRPRLKKALAVSLTAASISSMALVYSFNPYESAANHENPAARPAISADFRQSSLDSIVTGPEVLD